MKDTRKLSDLKEWAENPRNISDKDFERLKTQITKLGQYKPLLITPDGTVIGGNMRLKAYKALGIDDVWVSVVEPKDENEKLEYALSDNDRAGYYDDDLLANMMPNYDIDWSTYAIDLTPPKDIETVIDDLIEDEKEYSRKIVVPLYTPKGEKPPVSALYDTKKRDELLAAIEAAELPEDVRVFLLEAANRHTIFSYGDIAEYYAHAPKPVKDLMEKSALVILDYEKAIENGFVHLVEGLLDVEKDDYA